MNNTDRIIRALEDIQNQLVMSEAHIVARLDRYFAAEPADAISEPPKQKAWIVHIHYSEPGVVGLVDIATASDGLERIAVGSNWIGRDTSRVERIGEITVEDGLAWIHFEPFPLISIDHDTFLDAWKHPF